MRVFHWVCLYILFLGTVCIVIKYNDGYTVNLRGWLCNHQKHKEKLCPRP